MYFFLLLSNCFPKDEFFALFHALADNDIVMRRDKKVIITDLRDTTNLNIYAGDEAFESYEDFYMFTLPKALTHILIEGNAEDTLHFIILPHTVELMEFNAHIINLMNNILCSKSFYIISVSYDDANNYLRNSLEGDISRRNELELVARSIESFKEKIETVCENSYTINASRSLKQTLSIVHLEPEAFTTSLVKSKVLYQLFSHIITRTARL